MNHQQYIGRFAPSPSGPLHLGSLVAALGSYLRARSQNGQWLVRVEDIDPPREIQGATDDILRTLEAYGLHWDGDVLYQSERLDTYQHQIDKLVAQDKAYYCQCSRKQIKAMGGTYDGRCGRLTQPHISGAIRIRNTAGIDRFDDVQMGEVRVDNNFATEDFIIKRSDGLFAYQLAVVMDDGFQKITEVTRGSDLLIPTCRQISLFQMFNQQPPTWLHLPLICTSPGMKLSKQNYAAAIDKAQPQISFNAALAFLGQARVSPEQQMEKMVSQAVAQFDLSLVPKQTEIIQA
ncbi:tRNA glutamyl-Q(34) synthetase GluQRS [Shewanella violacea]|uniref:Glutamyl-Q tRNA(Asp) synthetase n=1 Tax=Shewanella violacea (strain JCM 10179 / CIP 106290 / LMG 19151 / DSS12) TaxID=637905 RepID=D4ZC47_SHEVD|nr:tRNA glutamyl-Q(34) synthetase GluQRS [Shewanella violacea]BAJ03592.1 glutamyl-tRNA synthetase domain protein [Shewanella violacea DSS12]